MPPPPDDEVIYPSPATPLNLMVGTRSAWFLSTPSPAGFGLFTPNWRYVLQAIGIHTLDINPHFAYCTWVLRSMKDLLMVMSNVSQEAAEFLKGQDLESARRVLVCHAGGFPFGDYLLSMSLRPARYTCLLIMFFGHRNAAPCSCCAKRYASTCCEFTNRSGQQRVANVNYPFLYCISHPEIANGKCANCVYHVISDCEYNTNSPVFQGYKCISRRAAKVSDKHGCVFKGKANLKVVKHLPHEAASSKVRRHGSPRGN